jgi:hypothetical protein
VSLSDKDRLLREYVDGRISRRAFIRGLVLAGVSVASAAYYADAFARGGGRLPAGPALDRHRGIDYYESESRTVTFPAKLPCAGGRGTVTIQFDASVTAAKQGRGFWVTGHVVGTWTFNAASGETYTGTFAWPINVRTRSDFLRLHHVLTIETQTPAGRMATVVQPVTLVSSPKRLDVRFRRPRCT